jgi:hypothetical protein
LIKEIGGIMYYAYGMKARGFSLGCQPMIGLVKIMDDKTGFFFDVLFYENKLSDEQVRDYELHYLGEVEDA